MTDKELLNNIYKLALDGEIILNIKRKKYIIEKLWNVNGGIIAFIGNSQKYINPYVDQLKITDQIFIYRKLLKMDIYKKMKSNYPNMNKSNIRDLTNNIFNKTTKQKNTVHRN